MHTERVGSTRRIVADVAPVLGYRAALIIVPGNAPSHTYLWIGADHDGECIGTISGAELRRLGRAILRETKARKRRAKAQR